MKKTLFAITAMVMSLGAYAQSQTQTQPPPDTTQLQTSTQNYPDGFFLRKGKVIQVRNQKLTVMKNDTTLANGITIMRDGNYMRRGGTKMMLKEGQHIDLMGKITTLPGNDANDKKKMYLVPDTVKNKKN